MIAAKAIFYAAASLVVCLAVVGMYQPRLLLNPYLWGAAVCGSVAYVAIGTVVVSVVRRQTTINTVSMLYLIATSLMMILSQFLPLFTVFKWCWSRTTCTADEADRGRRRGDANGDGVHDRPDRGDGVLVGGRGVGVRQAGDHDRSRAVVSRARAGGYRHRIHLQFFPTLHSAR